MEFEWDEAKRLKNLAKHKLDFGDAALLDWANVRVIEDRRKDYREPRYWAFAKLNGRLYLVAFILRGDRVRLISFRKANRKEVVRYGQA
jgi:uncharacterized protein